MNNLTALFTVDQGSLLVKLLLAQVIGDFLLQTTAMADGKKWFSKEMGQHIAITFASTLIVSGGHWVLAIAISATHWLIDSIKAELEKRKFKLSKGSFFIIDQMLHVLVILSAWAWHYHIFTNVSKAIILPTINYQFSLILLGYGFVIWPISFLIKFATQYMMTGGPHNSEWEEDENTQSIAKGGERIGQYERIIILTFVLLQQYAAIGFLITGKSIMRFAQKDEKLRSEYVLAGTMMSYAFSIIAGVAINWLLSIK